MRRREREGKSEMLLLLLLPGTYYTHTYRKEGKESLPLNSMNITWLDLLRSSSLSQDETMTFQTV